MPPYERYWFAVAPFSIVLVGAIAGSLRGRTRVVVLAPLVLLLAASIPVTLFAMQDRTTGTDDQRLNARILNPASEREMRATDEYWRVMHDGPALAKVIDEASANGLVLVDSDTAYPMIIASKHPKRLVITNDRNFFPALADPSTYNVRYIMVAEPAAGGTHDVIERDYPGIFQNGARGMTLVNEIDDLFVPRRLYRIGAAEP